MTICHTKKQNTDKKGFESPKKSLCFFGKNQRKNLKNQRFFSKKQRKNSASITYLLSEDLF